MLKEIDDILIQFNNKVTLSEFIGKYIEVIPRGNNFIARCPFHNEKTPSFSINNEIFKRVLPKTPDFRFCAGKRNGS